MKKLEKEAVLKERKILISAVSFFIFIMPYIVHLFVNGIQPAEGDNLRQSNQTIQVRVEGRMEKVYLETYLVGSLARYANADYTDEALKAIAVALRSNAVCTISDGGAVWRNSFYTYEEMENLWGTDYEINLQRFKSAVESTRGIVIFYGGEIVRVPFHKISAGATRDAGFTVEQMPYVHSVESSEDMYGDEYYKIMEISNHILGEDFLVKAVDAYGYATRVQVKGEEQTGEAFRLEYGLPSACFDYEKKENSYVFYIRGVGHGYGLSLYGANALSQKGWNFAEILEYYFKEIEIRKENRSDIIAIHV